MTLPKRDTIVLYPLGDTRATTRVTHVMPAGDAVAVILDRTPCHPVDAFWPDQPADRGVLRTGRGEAVIDGCVIAAIDGGDVFLGEDAPVRPGADGWVFAVAHVIDPALAPEEGEEVEVVVDEAHRAALSAGHTGCHLVSLALNQALAPRWTKDARPDGLGSPDFDQLAIESSRILPNGSLDRFRLNKSLRRKGFVADGLGDDLPAIEDAVRRTLAEWILGGQPVAIERDGDGLTDRRYWACVIDGHAVRIPCGGTHVGSLAELAAADVRLSLEDDAATPVLVMATSVRGDA